MIKSPEQYRAEPDKKQKDWQEIVNMTDASFESFDGLCRDRWEDGIEVCLSEFKKKKKLHGLSLVHNYK